jgi:hypothetical protein
MQPPSNCRLCRAWRQAVRRAVSHTVANPNGVNAGLRNLAAILSRHPAE